MAVSKATEPENKRQSNFSAIRAVWMSLLAIFALIVIGGAGFALWLDSDSGHDFIIAQVEALEPEDGLRIEIGSLEGSVFNNTRIKELKLSDPKGVFFSAGETAIEWNPLAWIFDELNISRAIVSQARLERLPELIPSTEESPLLPAFDIYIGSFSAENLLIGPAVTGEEQFADLVGALDIT